MKTTLTTWGIALMLCLGLATAFAQVDKTIISREKAAIDAWQKKDKAFFMDLLTEDATFYGPRSPYLATDPKVNFLPKFDIYAERFKILDFQMLNPRVQVYGDVAILTYNEEVTAKVDERTIDYSGKVTSIYVRQGSTWRQVHGHEAVNPGTP
jgi:ketosteroid isomerase-like protein